MSKYDFGYELQENTTNKWAYEQIAENSEVLEIGPSIGCLTYNLQKNKNCFIDIVEIDAESGERAAQYARESLLGGTYGNLNIDEWYQTLQGKKYDYIVALDVLEHLENPEKVLGLLRSLLKEKGKVILSIPNVAHNSIVLELLNHRFDYSDLGLLDRTHIHFFAQESIREMLEMNKLYINKKDAIIKNVLETEFTVNYQSLPNEVERFLRTRENGDVYQYLLVLQTEQCETKDKIESGIAETSLYSALTFVNGLSKYLTKSFYKGNTLHCEIQITEEMDANSIRFVPLEQPALVSELRVYACNKAGKREKIVSNWSTGVEIDTETFLMPENKYEINYILPEETSKVEISCRCVNITSNFAEIVSSLGAKNTSLMNDNCTVKGQLEECFGMIKYQKSMLLQQEEKINTQENRIEEQRNIITEYEAELEQIKKTKLYKIARYLDKQKRKVVKLLWKE